MAVIPSMLALTAAWTIAPFGAYAASAGAVVADLPTYTPGVAAWPSGKGFDVVYRTSAGNVAFRNLRDGVWSAPLNLGGKIVNGPSITFANRVPHVYGRGTDGRLWERKRVGGTWQAWTLVGGRLLSAAPAAVGRPGGRVDVFIRDVYDRLQSRTYTPGSGWGSWTLLGGTLYSAPSAALTGANSLRVVAAQKNSSVGTLTLTGSTWSAWQSLGETTHSSPAVAADPATGRTWVVIRDTSSYNRLRLRTYDGSWSSRQVVGGQHVDGTVLDADALPQIVQGLRDRGYSFVTLDALLS